MLTAAQLEALAVKAPPSPSEGRTRSAPSLKQQYHEYVMQRIEDFKDSLTRSELLRLGDDAARELQAGTSGQLLLTEVLMQETVDQQIVRRLNLPSFRKWRSKILPLREAQRSPTRWGIGAHDPVAVVLPRLEAGDRVLVIGGAADRAAYLLAAHDLAVVCLVADTATAHRIEDTLSTEALGGRCEVFVVGLGGPWLPPMEGLIHLVVVDATTLLALAPERQTALATQVQQLTAPEGLHCVVSSDPNIAPEACLCFYPDWQRIDVPQGSGRVRRGQSLRGVLLAGPPIPPSALSLR